MLDSFRDEIPNVDDLVAVIKEMIHDPQYSLEDVREKIVDHVSDHKGIHADNDEKLSEVNSTAYNAIDDLIEELQEDEINCKRIRDYISSYHSYSGFNRIIIDFKDFMTDKERRQLVDDGKRIFVSEITEHWI